MNKAATAVMSVLLLTTTTLVPYKIKENVIKTNRPDIIYPLLEEFAEESRLDNPILFLAQNLQEIKIVSSDNKELNSKKQGALYSDSDEILGRVIYEKKPSGFSKFYVYELRILLNKNLLESDYATRHVLFHEIGHLFGLKHNNIKKQEDDVLHIMNANFPLWYAKQYPQIKKHWNKHSAAFFRKVKASNRNRWLRRFNLYCCK